MKDMYMEKKSWFRCRKDFIPLTELKANVSEVSGKGKLKDQI